MSIGQGMARVLGWITKGRDPKVQPVGGISPAEKAEMNRQISRWGKAINEFGALMEDHPMTVLPESNLPLPKADMKEALRYVWFSMPDARTRGFAEGGFLHLSHFRSDVTEPVSLRVPNDPSLSPVEQARQVVEWHGRTSAISALVIEEEAALSAEFAAIKTGEPPFSEFINARR